MKKLFTLISFLLIALWTLPAYSQANPQTVSRIRGASADLANIAGVNQLTINFPLTTWGIQSRSGNYYYNTTGATWQYWEGLQAAATSAVIPNAPYVLDIGYFHANTLAQLNWINGDPLTHDDIVPATVVPYYGTFLHAYDSTGAVFQRVNLLATNADGIALDVNSLMTASVMYGYNGATLDMIRLGAVREVQMTDVATRPGEDAGNDWRKVKKEEIATLSPAPEVTAAIGTAKVTVYASTEVLTWPNFCIYVENTDGADAMTDVDIEASPDQTLWIDLGWAACDALAAGAGCVYCVGDNSYRYIRVQAAAADANPTSSNVWITGNKN